MDSDANETSYTTPTLTLAPGEINDTVDCGLVWDPLLVELLSFQVHVKKRGAVISWETASELNIMGFNLLRQMVQPDGTGSRMSVINKELVSNQGDAYCGALYHYIDPNIIPGTTYRYYLQALDYDGKNSMIGTVEITIRHRK